MYDKLVYKLGSLHSLLRELEAAGVYQGEHTITYAAADGAQQTIHIYIDGTELQMGSTPGSTSGFSISSDVFQGDE